MNLLRALFLIALVFPGSALAASGGGNAGARGQQSAIRAATVTVNNTAQGTTIPANFVGYSINPSSVIHGYLSGAGSLCSLAGMVGTNGILRIGGSDQDTNPAPALTQQIANNLEAFRACLGAGWTLIYGLDAAINNPSTAATQAGYIANATGSKAIFQFGNEPVSSGNFTISSYQTMWNSYYTAVITAVPAAQLAAWDDWSFGSTQTVINGLTGGVAGLKYITNHWYNNPCGQAQPFPWIINTTIAMGVLTEFYFNDQWAAANGVPQLLSESNSICGGGVLGISDRLVSTAWYLNEAITLANAGWQGISTHNNLYWSGAPVILTANPNTYGALLLENNGNFVPGSVFYGLYLFSKIEGSPILASSVGGNSNINVIASKRASGNANIIIVNNDLSSPVAATPQQSSAWTTATVLLVQDSDGQGCGSVNVVVGGQPIGESGSWTGAPYTINNGQSVQIPPCGAALIQVQP